MVWKEVMEHMVQDYLCATDAIIFQIISIISYNYLDY